ncbi:MAG: glycosyltransferase family 2 protein [Bacteroidetes bacterium]|nr:MAG: glycosyltransferase family 2 protein [Bacteroidota bacterium]
MKLPISVVILTFNEEKNIEETLSSVKKLTNDIVIIDSFSSDQTIEIAEKYNCFVLQNKFETFTKQWDFGLKNTPYKSVWILGLDADQVLSNELIDEVKDVISLPQSVSGFYIKRKMFFLDKWIKHGGYYPLYLLKLFKSDAVYLDKGELMEHHFYVNGATKKLKNDIIENNKNETIEFWLNKHVKYAKMQALEEFTQSKSEKKGNLFGNINERKTFLRKQIWENLPLFVRPFIYFIYRFIFLLGFLDGRRGLIFHFLQAFWYRFVVDAKIYELKNNAKS